MQLGAVIDTVIGVAFVFFLLALASSAVAEWVATLLRKRAKYLLRGLRDMLDGPQVAEAEKRADQVLGSVLDEVSLHAAALQRLGGHDTAAAKEAATKVAPRRRSAAERRGGPAARVARDAGGALADNLDRFLAHPLVRAQATTTGRSVTRAPSYLSPQVFVGVLADTFIPDANGRTTVDGIAAAIEDQPNLPDDLKRSLVAVVRSAGTEVKDVRTALEGWYDATMERVSGSYKRWVKRWLAVIATVVVLVVHVDAFAVASTLYTDPAVRAAVVDVAGQSSCRAVEQRSAGGVTATASSGTRTATATAGSGAADAGDATKPPTPQETRQCLEQARADLVSAGLPIGPPPGCSLGRFWVCLWGNASGGPVTPGSAIITLVGLALSVLAATFGAPFWFTLLTRVANLRNTGAPPKSAATSGSS